MVENAKAVKGTNKKPSPRPCRMPVCTTVQEVTSVVKRVIQYSEVLVKMRPASTNKRALTRPDMRPTTTIASMVPTPRGANKRPTSITG